MYKIRSIVHAREYNSRTLIIAHFVNSLFQCINFSIPFLVAGYIPLTHLLHHFRLCSYRRLRSLSTGAYRSNSGGMGAKKRAGAY